MSRVNQGTNIQLYLLLTCLSTSGMSHTCLYSPAAERHRTLATVLISRPSEGRRLSWPGWLDKILRWFASPTTVANSSTLLSSLHGE